MLIKSLLTAKNPFIKEENLKETFIICKDITKSVTNRGNYNSLLEGYMTPRRHLQITPFNNTGDFSLIQHPFSYVRRHLQITPFNNIEGASIIQHPFISQRRYLPQPVRDEFKSKITLTQLKNINYKKDLHFKPQKYSDYITYSLVKAFRFLADLYFQKRYVHRAIVLETVASIPGMVGGLFRHLYSLRSTVDNGTTIQKLLLEAENERQHLLTFLEVARPSFLDTLVIYGGQIFFFSFYFIFYFFFPKSAHRFVGYLEEEAIRSYDMFEQEILVNNIDNVCAPRRAILYWNLPSTARLIDVVRAVRADEAAHRDTNHAFANQVPFSLK